MILKIIFWATTLLSVQAQTTFNIQANMFLHVTNTTIHIPVFMGHPINFNSSDVLHAFIANTTSFTDLENESHRQSGDLRVTSTSGYKEMKSTELASSEANTALETVSDYQDVQQGKCSKCIEEYERARKLGYPAGSKSYKPDMAESLRPHKKKTPRSKRSLLCEEHLEWFKYQYFVLGRNNFSLICNGVSFKVWFKPRTPLVSHRRANKKRGKKAKKARRPKTHQFPIKKNSLLESDETSANTCNLETISHFDHKWAKKCNSWAGISVPSNKTLCTYNVGCYEGFILDSNACVEHDADHYYHSICGSGDFKFSNKLTPRYPLELNLVSGNLCFISEQKIKECHLSNEELRTVSMIGVNGQEIIATEPHHFIFDADLSEILNYHCVGCISPACTSCHGDENYQKNFKLITPSQCNCTLRSNPRYGKVTLIHEDKTIPVNYYVSEMLKVTVEAKPEEKNKNKAICLDCRISCKTNKLTIKALDYLPERMTICTRSGCTNREFHEVTTIPYGLLLITKSISIKLITKNK